MDDLPRISAPTLAQADLRMLRALCAVARAGGFQAAADELGYTQSAISQQIAALERQLGMQLIGRGSGRRPVALTDAGAIVRTHAEAILTHLQAADTDLAALTAGSRGTLRVGFFRSLMDGVLPPVLAEMAALSPEVQIVLEERGSGHDIQRDVAYGDLDLSFAVLPVDQLGLTAHELFDDPYVVVVRRDDPLAGGHAPLALEQLDGRPLAASNCPHQAIAEAAILRAGITPGVTFRSDDNGMLVHFAASGMAAALVPRLVAGAVTEDLVALPAGHLFPPRRIGLIRHAHRVPSPAAERFIEVTQRVCATAGAGPELRAAASAS